MAEDNVTTLPVVRIERYEEPKFGAWQPIETAPKDRRSLLLYEEKSEGLGVFVGYYCGPNSGWRPLCAGPLWEVNPTHWMLPPEPPHVDHRQAKDAP